MKSNNRIRSLSLSVSGRLNVSSGLFFASSLVLLVGFSLFTPILIFSQDTPVVAPDTQPKNIVAPNSEKSEQSKPEDQLQGQVMNWRFWDLEFTKTDMSILPNGNHNFFPLEYWYPGAVLSNPDNGGFSMLEPVTLAIHGESVKWMRYRVNGLDITNPDDPGRPLIYLPVDLWSHYRVLSPLHSYSDDFGLNWTLGQDKINSGMVSASNTGHLGGESWIPLNFMDRDPAQLWGANTKRRSMAPSPEGAISLGFAGINALPAKAFYEGVHHERTFTTLKGYENGNRHTLYLGQNISENQSASVVYQRLTRDHFGIETGNQDSMSLHGGTDSFLATLAAIDQDREKLSYGVNAGYIHKKYEQNNPNPLVLDLVDQILYGKIPEPTDSHSWFVSNNLDFNKITQLWIFDIDLNSKFRIEGVHRQNLYAHDMIAHTFNQRPYDVTIYTQNEMYSQYLARLSPGIVLSKQWQSLKLEINGGVLLESGFSNSSYLLTRFDPIAGIKLSTSAGSKWELYSGLQHDAIPVSSDELAFLNPDSPSGARYAWNDTNKNGIAETGENGAVYNRTGGKYHTLSADMKFPTRDELYVGVAHNFTKKWSTMLSIHGKRFANLYDVAFDPSVDSGYSEIARSDVNGGLLYNRDINAMGNEIYMLTNSGKDGYYAAVEMQLLKKNDRTDPWFFQASIGAYYSQAYTIPGNGPDYNDMGQFSESSADPNKHINTLAITDYDRAYVIDFLLGFNSGPFSISNSLRYRDGQPFGRMIIAQGLTQGPVIVQNQERSEPPKGMPRFTFALTWDVRLAVNLPHDKVQTAISLDIFNLFNSSTELYEYTLGDERYRDPIETVTGRYYRVMMHMYW